jgi:signal peptidase II
VRQSLSWLVLVTAALVTIGCDRMTKHAAAALLAGEPGRSYMADTVRLDYAENAGGFLSVGTGLPRPARTAIFTIGTGLALVGIVIVALRRRVDGWAAFGLVLFVAGGASNWIDRVLHGRVVDFLNVGVGPIRTGIFNVADVAITVGAAILAISAMPRHRSPRASETPKDARP